MLHVYGSLSFCAGRLSLPFLLLLRPCSPESLFCTAMRLVAMASKGSKHRVGNTTTCGRMDRPQVCFLSMFIAEERERILMPVSVAVFMVLGAFWGQVEYRGCQIIPWLLMSRSQVAAADGLLLDYISPWNVLSLFTSVKRRHYLVSLVISGTLLVHGLAVVSTSLFVLRDVTVTRLTPLRLTHDFNLDPDAFKPRDVSTVQHMRAKGIAINGSDVPIGIISNRVFSPFHEARSLFSPGHFTLGDLHEIEAEVDVLSVEVQCEKANMQVTEKQSAFTFSMKSGSCSTGPLDNYLTQNVVFQDPAEIYFEGFPAACDEGKGAHNIEYDQYKNANWRIWAYISRRDPTGVLVNATNANTDEHGSGRFAFTSVLCTPYLDMTRGPVKLSRSSDGISIITDLDMKKQRPSPSPPSTLDINAGALLYGAFMTMLVAEGDGWSLLGPRSEDREAFFNPALLAQEMERGLQDRAVHVARDYLLQPADRHTEGKTTRTESRLFVRKLSFGLAVGFLSTIIIISTLIIRFYLPLAVCCRDPSSIGGLATILARSPELMATLENMNLKWPSEMKKLLVGWENRTGVNLSGEFQIEVHDERTSAVQVSKSGTHNTPRWWRPISSRPSVKLLTFVLPLAVIATLEALLHVSNTKGGITPVDGRQDGRDQPWAYIPALVMFWVRILYQMMESTVKTFQPFHYLARGGARASASVLESQHRKITAWVVLDSLRKRQWALAASAVALLIAGALPITVSGLYAVDRVPYPTDISLVQRSTWNISSYKEYLDDSMFYDLGSSNFAPGRILYLNMSYPQGTYADLAFPDLSLSRADDNGRSESTSEYIQVRLPAWRPDLNCEGEIPASDYEISWVQKADPPRYDLFVNSTRRACSFSLHGTGVGGAEYFSSWYNMTQDSYKLNRTLDEAHGGSLADCPTALYLFGDRDKTRMLRCRPQIEEVDVDFRFEQRSLMINPDHPPSIVPGSARPPLGDIRAYSSGTAVPDTMLPEPGFFNFDLMAYTAPREEYNIDHLTTAAIFGAGGIPAAELLSDTGKLARALNRIYGIVISQRINDNWRIPLDPASSTTPKDGESNPPRTLPAKLVHHRDSLVQKKLSTRLLDTFLASMVLLAIASTLLMNTKNVLPKNPCSIAAVASLLAGSRILGDPAIIPRGAEWWDNAELVRRGVFAGSRFSMGWWIRRRRWGSGNSSGEDIVIERHGEGDGLLEEEERVFGIDVDDRGGY